MKWLAIIIILSATAQAAQTNWPSVLTRAGKPSEQAEAGKAVTAERFKIKAEKKDKDGKKETREFPLMFDIADKARKAKADKKKGKDK